MPFSEDPERVGRFVRLVESDQGYTLYKSVSDTEGGALARGEREFVFRGPGFEIREIVRAQFESWIAPELESIEEALDRCSRRVDRRDRRGSRVPHRRHSFVPAVRRIFERRFGADMVESGNEFVSIANGLATIGLREDVDAWTVSP